MHFWRAAEFYCLFYVAQMRPSNRVRKEDQNFIPYLKFEKLKIHVSNITYQSVPYVSHENPWPSKTLTFIVEKANISNTCTESAKLRPKKMKNLVVGTESSKVYCWVFKFLELFSLHFIPVLHFCYCQNGRRQAQMMMYSSFKRSAKNMMIFSFWYA